MGCGDVDDVDVWVADELEVGAVCFGRWGGFYVGEECLCAADGGGAGGCGDDVLDV